MHDNFIIHFNNVSEIYILEAVKVCIKTAMIIETEIVLFKKITFNLPKVVGGLKRFNLELPCMRDNSELAWVKAVFRSKKLYTSSCRMQPGVMECWDLLIKRKKTWGEKLLHLLQRCTLVFFLDWKLCLSSFFRTERGS